MTAAKQKAFQAAADKAIAWSAAEHAKREAELADTFRKQGWTCTCPTSMPFASMRRRCTWRRTTPRTGRRHARQDQRAEVRPGAHRVLRRCTASPKRLRPRCWR
jgi:hypothetical protein